MWPDLAKLLAFMYVYWSAAESPKTLGTTWVVVLGFFIWTTPLEHLSYYFYFLFIYCYYLFLFITYLFSLFVYFYYFVIIYQSIQLPINLSLSISVNLSIDNVSLQTLGPVLVLFKKAIPVLFFIYFRLFNSVNSKIMFNVIFLMMTGFEPRTFGVISDHSTNRATPLPNFECLFNIRKTFKT